MTTIFMVMRSEESAPGRWPVAAYSTRALAEAVARAFDLEDEHGLYAPHEVEEWQVDPPLQTETKVALSLRAFRAGGVGDPRRTYANDTLVIDRVGDDLWQVVLGNRLITGQLEDCERALCEWALSEGYEFPYSV